MRMLMTAKFPPEPFNALTREGRSGALLQKIVGELKPQAAYFTEEDGCRCAVFVIEVADASRIPSFAEPLFLNFNAECRFRIAMTPEDLGKAGLEELGKKWR
jgi:hypothetical protein